MEITQLELEFEIKVDDNHVEGYHLNQTVDGCSIYTTFTSYGKGKTREEAIQDLIDKLGEQALRLTAYLQETEEYESFSFKEPSF